MRFNVLYAFALGLLFSCSCAAHAQSTKESELARAEKYLLYGQADSAQLLLKDWPQEITVNYLRAQALLSLAEARSSATYQAQGRILSALEAQNIHFKANVLLKAELLNISAEIRLLRGQFEQSLEEISEAESHLSNLKQNGTVLESNVLTTKGLVFWSTGATELAFEYLNRALSIRQAQTNDLNRDILVASSRNNLGLVLLSNEPKKALAYYENALGTYEKNLGAEHPLCAVAYTNMALADLQLSDIESSIRNSKQALKIRQRTLGNKHPNTGFAYFSLAQVYLQSGDMDEAAENFQEAERIYMESYAAKHPEMANLYNAIAVFEFRKGKLSRALNYIQKAIEANLRPSTNSDKPLYFSNFSLLTSYLYQAKILSARYQSQSLKLTDLKKALENAEAADSLLIKIRFARQNKSDQIALGALSKDIYETATQICLILADNVPAAAKYQKLAFYYAERSKAAVLLSAIAETQAKSYAGIPERVLGQELELKTNIASLEKALSERNTPAAEDALKQQLFEQNRAYEAFIKNLEQAFPQYYNLKYNFSTVKVEEVQQVLRDKELLVSYFFNNATKRLYIFKVSKNKLTVRDVAINPRTELSTIGIRSALEYESVDVFMKSSTALYEQFIKPLGAIKNAKNLIIVPEGKLGTLPFETFIKKKRSNIHQVRYLLEDVACSYTFSATLFVRENLKKTEQENFEKSALLMAPVLFKSAANGDDQYKSMNNLPASEQEIKEIKAILEKNNLKTMSLLRAEALESTFKSQDLSGFQYVHLATHGLVNESRPDLSQVFLGQDDSKREDGHLYASEIYNLKLQAKVVSLSACQTGLGKIAQGEGIIGLTRAFLYAGAQRVLVSLWSVADESTAQLMIAFYGHLMSGMSETAALRQAKLDLLINYRQKGTTTLDAHYWSPFVLIGR